MPRKSDVFKLCDRINASKYKIKEAKSELYRANKFFGQAFRSERERLGLSLTDVAKKTGYSKAYISDMELGRRAPNDTLQIFLTPYLLKQ